MNEHRYNIPMFGVKHWYEHEMEAVGHLASMDDAYLRRMYASKVVNGMNHLSKAIEEKVDDHGYKHKKRDLELMKASVQRAMEHLKSEYDVTEHNISYKWNTKNNTRNNRNNNWNSNSNSNKNIPPSFVPSSLNNENTLSLNENDYDEPVLTLNNMKNFATAKTKNLNMNNTLNVNKNVLNLNKNTSNSSNTSNSLNFNRNKIDNNFLNVNTSLPNLNKNNSLNFNKNKINNDFMNVNTLPNTNANTNKNKNKKNNTLSGGHRKNRKGRQTRRK